MRIPSLIVLLLSISAFTFGQTPQASFTSVPVAVAGSISICSGDVVSFVNTSSQTLPGSTYSWNFGSGASPSTASGPGPHSVTFTGGSSFTVPVTLTVNNNNSSPTSTSSVTVNVTSVVTPALSLLSSGAGFSTATFNNLLLFKNCGSQTSALFEFQSNFSSATTQLFNWGDGSSSTQSSMTGNLISHTFPIGQFTVTHTVTVNGCTSSREYIVFNGEAPVISITGSGQNFCIPSPFTVDISSNNVPINYSVAFSDGSPSMVFSTASDTTLSYIFTTTSCGIDYVFAPGVPPIENSFSVSVVGQNLCSTNGLPTVLTLGPITVSSGPTANFTYSPASPICEGEDVTFENTTIAGENITSSGCNSQYTYYWLPVQTTGYTLNTGTFGSSNGFTGTNYDYTQWTSGSNELNITFSTPGTYQFWLYTANSCGIDSIMQQLVINPTATVVANPVTQTICSGELSDNVTLTSTVPGYTINWEITSLTNVTTNAPSQGSGVSPTNFSPFTFSNTSNQSGEVQLSATVGCTSVPPTVFTIIVNPQGNVTLDPVESTICSGESTGINLTSNLSNATFTWTASGPPSITGESNGSGTSIAQILNNTGTQMDTMVYTVSIGNVQCPGPAVTAQVIVQPGLTLSSNADITACPGSIITPPGYTTNPPGGDITWTNSNSSIGLASSGSGNLPSWTALNSTNSPINGTITVIAQLNDCPAVQDVWTVTVNPLPNYEYIFEPATGLNCDLDPMVINGTVSPSTTSVSWTGPSLLTGANTPVISLNEPGSYTITLTDNASGCVAFETIPIDEPNSIAFTSVSVTDVTCFNGFDGSITVQTDNPAENVTFNLNLFVDIGPSVTVNSGYYTYSATNEDNCSTDTTVFVDQGTPIVISLVDSIPSECLEWNGSLSVSANGGNGGFNFNWLGGTEGPTINGIDEGNYIVYVTDAEGCEAAQAFSLGCNPLIPIDIPQFLSPNGDGLNETWILKNLEQYPEIEVKVYNRWGNLVFEADPYENDWNGHYRGTNAESLPAATYFYVIDTKKKSQDPITGFIEIQP
jgi:gliding motility-associated-like protein